MGSKAVLLVSRGIQCVRSAAILKIIFVHAVPLLLMSVKHVGANDWKPVARFQMETGLLAMV